MKKLWSEARCLFDGPNVEVCQEDTEGADSGGIRGEFGAATTAQINVV